MAEGEGTARENAAWVATAITAVAPTTPVSPPSRKWRTATATDAPVLAPGLSGRSAARPAAAGIRPETDSADLMEPGYTAREKRLPTGRAP